MSELKIECAEEVEDYLRVNTCENTQQTYIIVSEIGSSSSEIRINQESIRELRDHLSTLLIQEPQEETTEASTTPSTPTPQLESPMILTARIGALKNNQVALEGRVRELENIINTAFSDHVKGDRDD